MSGSRPPRRRMEPTGSALVAELTRPARTIPPEVARVRDALRVLATAYELDCASNTVSAITVYANSLAPIELEWLVAGIQPGTVEECSNGEWRFLGTLVGQLVHVYVGRGARANALARRIQRPVRAS